MKATQRIAILLASLLFAAPLVAEEEADESKTPSSAGEAEGASGSTEVAAEPPIYVPPSRGSKKVRIGAATRGEGSGLPRLAALAPDHVGLTSSPQPTLYWYVSGDTSTRIDFTLIDDTSINPLLDVTIDGPVEAGIHSVRLSDYGLSLKRGVTYQWFVALVPDPVRRSNDIVATAALEFVESDEKLELALSNGAPSESYRAYARHGFWYDAIGALNAQIENDPDATPLRNQLALLLKQADLEEVSTGRR